LLGQVPQDDRRVMGILDLHRLGGHETQLKPDLGHPPDRAPKAMGCLSKIIPGPPDRAVTSA
jgi:hypothetical protein